MTSGTRHLELVAPPPSPAPWWHLRPSERRPLAWIVGVGGPVGFLSGALLGIFLQVPGPALPASLPPPSAGRGTPVLESVAPPASRSAPDLTRPSGTGSDAATRRTARPDATRRAVSSPTGHAPNPPGTVTITATTRTSPSATPTTHPTGAPASGTPTDEERPAPEGGVSPGADPS